MNYRRDFTAGGSYFFTVNLADRQSDTLVREAEALRSAVLAVRSSHPFTVDAMVVLPDHLHAVWTLPDGDADYALRWLLIKARFSRGLPKDERVSRSRVLKRERGVWQRRYWEHRIRDAVDWQRHADYVHINPVRHGLVACVADWPFSSFHRFVREGRLPLDWGGGMATGPAGFGE